MNSDKVNPINRQILELHQKYSEQLQSQLGNNNLPMFYSDFSNTNNKILISGINPSFSLKHYRNYPNLNVFDYGRFSLENQEAIIQELIRVQNCFIHGNDQHNQLRQIPYFRSIDEFAKNIGASNQWDHFDMFPHRRTEQHEFFKVINNIPGYKEAAFQIYRNFLNETDYKVVCIFNGGATRLLLGNKFKSLINFEPLKITYKEFANKKYGFYKAKVEGKEINFFLYKMISGAWPPSKNERSYLYGIFKEWLTS